jgi:magnesium transporter
MTEAVEQIEESRPLEVVKPELAFELERLVQARELRGAREHLAGRQPADIAELISTLSGPDEAIVFRILPRDLAGEVFAYMQLDVQKNLLSALGDERVAVILNEMAPDDRTALLEEFPAAAAKQLVTLLSREERTVALSLLGYPENSVGRHMTPDYIQARSDWTVRDVIDHIREHSRETDTIYVIYVVDERGKLTAAVSLRELLIAPVDKRVGELTQRPVIALHPSDDQEESVRTFKRYDFTVLPVVDSEGFLLGIVTIDDILDIAEEEATEDIQKIGGVEVLEDPYIKIPLATLIRKRASWLVFLFLGEMLTASAMAFFEKEIARAVVLALFIPLIISSGGNSGSQAATLIIRALAIGEISLRDWLRVLYREIAAGLSLGIVLGLIGALRVTVWSAFADLYGPHWPLVALVVGLALVAVVLWGAVAGAMLPFVLKRLHLDPATSSAPFVATLVDVTGLVLYFTIASWVLQGILL